MGFNRTKHEIAEEQRYLDRVLGRDNVGRCEAARQRVLAAAVKAVEQRFGGEYLELSDPGLRATLETRNAEGWCDAGSIHEGGPQRRWWIVRWNPETGKRVLRRVQ